MKKTIYFNVLVIAAMTASTSCNKENDAYVTTDPPPNVTAVVRSAAGDSAGIVVKVNEFRLLSGDPLNAAPGATAGRREVNWDAVPANLTNANNFPFSFFGESDAALPNGRKRGLILQNAGATFRVDSTAFSGVDASYSSQFETFSKKRLFANMAAIVTEVTFKVPGSNTDAFVKGFGVIFTDVDNAASTSIEYFNGTKSLGVYKAPIRTVAGSFSFLGVGFPNEKVTRVRITSGNAVLAQGVKDISNGGSKDLVVMDDFIYSEPSVN
ncbi:MAG: hypothetical protein H7Y86_05775 [Rhizobacter sp.]|nr:hypothetical protein [Ferruginibacter sp.]